MAAAEIESVTDEILTLLQMTKFRDTGESLRKRSSHKHPDQAVILADLRKRADQALGGQYARLHAHGAQESRRG